MRAGSVAAVAPHDQALDARTAAKKAAADHAVALAVGDGCRIGLGTGSTAVWVTRRIGELLAAGELRDVVGVPTSAAIVDEARQAGVPLTTLDETPRLHVTIDGADEVDPDLDLIKGGGGAHLQEKLVAQASERMVVVVDDSKLVAALGTTFALPVSVLVEARMPVTRWLEDQGYAVAWRRRPGPEGVPTHPWLNDQGHYVLDVATGAIPDKLGLQTDLLARAGVTGVGLFIGIATDLVVAPVQAGPGAAPTVRRRDPGA